MMGNVKSRFGGSDLEHRYSLLAAVIMMGVIIAGGLVDTLANNTGSLSYAIPIGGIMAYAITRWIIVQYQGWKSN